MVQCTCATGASVILACTFFPSTSDASYKSRIGNYGMSAPRTALLRLDIGRPDHFAPFFDCCGVELSIVGRRQNKLTRGQVVKACFDLGIGQGCVDFPVEPVDDLGGGIFG